MHVYSNREMKDRHSLLCWASPLLLPLQPFVLQTKQRATARGAGRFPAGPSVSFTLFAPHLPKKCRHSRVDSTRPLFSSVLPVLCLLVRRSTGVSTNVQRSLSRKESCMPGHTQNKNLFYKKKIERRLCCFGVVWSQRGQLFLLPTARPSCPKLPSFLLSA